ncbi:flagellar protein FliT [Metabacillus idriensis]|uniref:flagellar protein FliT n=1 Tax=Metabacillus idriensis TaxID=324768 RepID=UPI003D275529
MSAVNKLHQLTKQLLSEVHGAGDKDMRDSHIVNIQEWIEQRDSLIHQLKPPYNREEKQLGKEINEWNAIIHDKLNLLKQEIKNDITRLRVQKTSNQKYINPYQNASVDGMYYDKRK